MATTIPVYKEKKVNKGNISYWLIALDSFFEVIPDGRNLLKTLRTLHNKYTTKH